MTHMMLRSQLVWHTLQRIALSLSSVRKMSVRSIVTICTEEHIHKYLLCQKRLKKINQILKLFSQYLEETYTPVHMNTILPHWPE